MRIALATIPSREMRSLGVLATVETISYEVIGMPFGQSASLSNFGTVTNPNWQILREVGRFFSHWHGNFISADEALARLQAEIEKWPGVARTCTSV